MRLFRSGFGLAGLATRPGGGGRAELLETTDFGASFRVISPPTGRYSVVDDIWALSRSLIWFDTFSTLTTRERLYRTTDGGRSWSSAPAPGHSVNAEATSSIQFVTAQDGWLVAQEPTGPAAALLRTTDAGDSWHLVARGPPSPLRQVAPVEVDPASGYWQAGGLFSDRLDHGTDGGRRWRALNLTGAPARAWPPPHYGLPVIFPAEILVPVAVPDHAREDLLVYASRTDGRSWMLISRLRRIGREAPGGTPVPVAFTSPSTWWALYPGAQPELFLTTDSGRHWQVRRFPAGESAWQVVAADARHGWALASTRHGRPQLIITTNGGRTWRRARISAD